MDLSQYLEGKIVDWLRGSAFPSPPSALTLALSNGNPLDDGSSLVEPTHGYARQAIVFSSVVSDEEKSAMAQLGSIVFTPTSGEAFGTVTHGLIFDNSGNILFVGPLDAPGAYGVDQPISFATGTIRANLMPAFTSALAAPVLSWARGAAMPAAPTYLEMMLTTEPFNFDGTGFVEPGEPSGYTRQRVNFGAPTAVTGVGTRISNTAPILFGPAVDKGWGTIVQWALVTNTGLVVVFGALATPKQIPIGVGFGIETDSLALIVR